MGILNSLGVAFGEKKPQAQPKGQPQANVAVRTSYTSNPVPIPDDFLVTPPSQPVSSHPIDFAASPVPEHAGRLAIVLRDVLSPEECARLISLAEASVPRDSAKSAASDSDSPEDDSGSAWRPALINLGNGYEVAAPGYRVSDRIVWDQQDVVDRIWARCATVDGLAETLARVPAGWRDGKGTWRFKSMNRRMRFLRYGPGQYFKPHCDGPYWYFEEDEREVRTMYTVHLYLNDSAAESSTGEGHVGGATAFLSGDGKRKLDVNPKAGSVLIFQHEGLLHEGAEVKSGVKYTVRMDILYRWEPEE
ncbi:oxidoreductase domain-containing protein [Purpureocillium lavendulum]|uniref:Oxidoreductase domain-containing protein n=1 Tax=Purpureocillium lavendulum TaxID=1247861 RepID=A0AB34FEY1_9HYPO|nr:oxidoreductase domain-containing protein [Purpureocillium lavendulum]